ncbi:MAG: hypothetical protein VX965_07230 [Candidatus Thermoplasmatota archaeon]|nr:hypothetical protein [Candidatus Thermoplasmatota archaeon]MEC7508819.1 hypothetical protein [Candidatus Thermoplasmatota archaeon]MEC8766632.1 hypothetical protein [Candidatus Thermoplasmatota archaeon]
MSSLWADAVWEDPDGGKVIVHGTMPTVVYPNAMRPRATWHGLALLESPDIVDLWAQEEADEAESEGINLTHALLSGGAFGKYVEGIETLEDLQGGRFPDPEPRRLQRNADRHDRPVFFIEPLADDEDWSDYLTQEARAVSHWRKLLGMVRVGKRWKKSLKRHLFHAQPPPKGQSVDYSTASVLTAAWWELSEWLSTPALAERRNARYAARIRGALASLRTFLGDEATLLLVVHQPHAKAMVMALEANRAVEEISSTASDSSLLEEA